MPEARDRAARHGALSNLICRIPVGPITHACQREPIAVVAAAVAKHAVHLLVVVGPDPGAIVVIQLERREQEAVSDARGCSSEQPPPSVVARAQGHRWTIELIDVVDIGGTGRREIAFLGEVRPLLVLNAADEFRNQKADVGVSVRVRTGRRIHRHTGDRRREVRPVIEVEAAQVGTGWLCLRHYAG